MFAADLKVCRPMIEALFVELYELGVTALMLRMAGLAFRIRNPAVIPLGIAHVSANVLVAVHAKARLRGAIEADMTLGAICFEFGVAMDNLSWHQDGLETLCQARRLRNEHGCCRGEQSCKSAAINTYGRPPHGRSR